MNYFADTDTIGRKVDFFHELKKQRQVRHEIPGSANRGPYSGVGVVAVGHAAGTMSRYRVRSPIVVEADDGISLA